jgi:hypothetical protein
VKVTLTTVTFHHTLVMISEIRMHRKLLENLGMLKESVVEANASKSPKFKTIISQQALEKSIQKVKIQVI